MSAGKESLRLAQRLRRHHVLQRDEVDAMGWPHPRPSRDERLLGLNVAFIWTSIVQMIKGPPPTSVQSISFGYSATVVFSALMIICALLSIYAAYCKSQYNSFGVEAGACVGYAGVFAIYTVGAIMGLNDWYATNVAPLAICLFLGYLLRGWKLIRRLW